MAARKTSTSNSSSTLTIGFGTSAEPTESNETVRPKRTKKPKSIVDALDTLIEKAHMCKLKDSFFPSVKHVTDYLEERLGLSPFQQVTLAMLIDSGKPLSWKNFGTFLGCSRLKVMVYTDEVTDLVKKRWIRDSSVRDGMDKWEGFALEKGVVTACRTNVPFEPRKVSNLTITEFVAYFIDTIGETQGYRSQDFQCIEPILEILIDENPDLEASKLCAKCNASMHDKALLLYIMYDYIGFHNSDSEGVSSDELYNEFPSDYEVHKLVSSLQNGTHPFMQEGYIEFKNEDGFADSDTFVLTKLAQNTLFAGYDVEGRTKKKPNIQVNGLVKHNTLTEKALFYNEHESEMISKLQTLLSDDNLKVVQERMEENGLRKGFACLFYGAPGTGKTETVNQLGRLTKRDIIHVNIATMRDKFVGETEKNIKEVFSNYHALCNQYNEQGRPIPILLFNEADAIFGKRLEGGSQRSADKMENAMQNIILEEMESLEGILIATTNLTVNLDKAFERRFIFKVEFKKPTDEAKAKIWKSMLNDISDSDAKYLATHYDFSGGQIENINRKKVVDYILTGETPDLKQLMKYCDDEQLASTKTVSRINGFGKQ